MTFNTVSIIGSSTCWPTPVRSAKFSAAAPRTRRGHRPADHRLHAASPADRRAIRSPRPDPRSVPWWGQIRPARTTGHRAQRRHPGDDQLGVDLEQHVGSEPKWSITRGEKFSITTSAPATSSHEQAAAVPQSPNPMSPNACWCSSRETPSRTPTSRRHPCGSLPSNECRRAAGRDSP